MAKKTSLSLQRAMSPCEKLDAAINAFYRRCRAKNLSPHTPAQEYISHYVFVIMQEVYRSKRTVWEKAYL